MSENIPRIDVDEANENTNLANPILENTLPVPIDAEQEDFDYQLLVGHRRTDRSFKTGDQLRTEYVRLTDNLIHQMTDGVMVTDPETGEHTKQIPDAVVWLDKSARPLAWLTKDLWATMAADEEGNVPEMPDFYFANIDREQWVNTVDAEGTGAVNVDHIDPSIIRSLRSIYVDPVDKKDGITNSIDSAPAALDGKTILIIDEVKSSGRTLTYAKNFYGAAFPTAKIATSYWMSGMVRKGSAEGNADLPIWYKDSTDLGRGISNRNATRSQKSLSSTQRLGGWFLSTPIMDNYPTVDSETGDIILGDTRPLRERDPASWQLRRELGQLATDAANGNMLVVPSFERDMDQADAMAERLNPQYETIEDFYAAMRKLSEQKQ